MSSSQRPAPMPNIPDKMLARWHEIADLTADLVKVSATLINRFEPDHVEILAASSKAGNPFKPGDRVPLETGPCCAALNSGQAMILIPDARKDPAWKHSAAVQHGMISYLGFPFYWPDGELFGTICVMDSKKNEFASKHQRLLATLKNLVESDLRSLLQTREREREVDVKLKESEAKFATAFHKGPVPMVISTLEEGRLIEVNIAFEQVIGYTSEELVGRKALDLGLWFDPADREHWISKLQKHGTIRDIELCFRNKSGVRIYCSTTASVVMIGGERCLVTAVEDITKQRRVEAELNEIEKRYRSFVENFAGIAYQGKDFVVHFFHGDVEGITGYKEADFLAGNLKWNEVVHPDDIGVFKTENARKLHAPGGHAYERQYRIVRKDGRIVWINDHIQSVCDENGAMKYFQGTITDITERKQAEEVLRALAAELAATEERERHRIATYLHDQIGQSLAVTALKFGALSEEAGAEHLAGRIEEIGALLEEVMDDTRNLTFDLSPPILYELGLSAALEWFGERTAKVHGLQFLYSDDGQFESLDSDIAALIFRNARELIMNVIKHADADSLTASLKVDHGALHVSIEDDGVGFNVSEATQAGQSTGFGIFSIRERMNFIGGRLEIKSSPGLGTRANLSLPVSVRKILEKEPTHENNHRAGR